MAHFAKLDENNIVVDLIRISNWDILDEEGVESEEKGLELVRSFTGHNSWVQASYNCKFRKRYPSVGFLYDEAKDAFIPPKEVDNFIFDEDKLDWVPPIAEPSSGDWIWNFETNAWVEEEALIGDAGD